MPDTQTQPPDKHRKNRGLGAFLLFLTVLIVILVTVGGDRLGKTRELTQDQYLYHLYCGQVESQVFRGANKIEGRLRRLVSPDEKDHFRVHFTDLSPLAEELQRQKAIPRYEDVTEEALSEAMSQRWFRPQLVLSVTGYRQPPSEIGLDPPPDEVSEDLKVDVNLFVHGLAISRDEHRIRTSGISLQELPFPEEQGPLYLRVMNPKDIVATIASLEAAGATVQPPLSFDLREQKGSSSTDSNTMLSMVLLTWAPWILVFVVFMIFMRQMRAQGGAGGVMSFGRSRAQLYSTEDHTNTTFDDVAGVEEAKEEVSEIVEFLKNPSRFTRIGARIPRGVLLVGPPGCGKTLLAKAIAGEAEVPFFSISGSDFVEMFVGVGASRVRDLFKQARDNSPCIIFLDEIDAVGRRRGSGLGGGHDEREQTLNAILVEMDGFTTDEGIIVLAATNRPDVLDPALLRPGRFDREVVIDPPDQDGRHQILKVHLKKVKAVEDLDLVVLARSTPGYSGADLAAIVNEAAIRAALDRRDALNMEDLEESRDKVRYGRQKISRKMEEEDRKVTAYHESGHALVAFVLEEVEDPHKVTIIPRGRALGATFVIPEKESYHLQRRRMEGQLAMLFGGRVAEKECCGDISAGASDDIKRATELARAMVAELGMSDKVGPVNYAEREGNDFLGTELLRGRTHSEETAHIIDQEVRAMLDTAFARAEEVVRENREGLERLTDALMVYESLSKEEISRVLAGESADDLRRSGKLSQAEELAESRHEEAEEEKPAPDEGGFAGDLPGEPGLSPA